MHGTMNCTFTHEKARVRLSQVKLSSSTKCNRHENLQFMNGLVTPHLSTAKNLARDAAESRPTNLAKV